jgi:CobQ-like glutamine amidotransferase family enzyme
VDGFIAGGILATYLHGPALVRNPDLADYLLTRVVGALPTLPPSEEIAERLAAERRRAVGRAIFGK